MQRCILLLLLLAIDETWAKDPAQEIGYESGTIWSWENDPDNPINEDYLALIPATKLQNENAQSFMNFKTNLENGLKDLVYALPNTNEKNRIQALQEALAALTDMNLVLPRLQESLDRIRAHQANLTRQLKVQEEWKFWTAAQVNKVLESSWDERNVEIVSIIKDMNNHCVSDFLRAQIRFNLQWETTLGKIKNHSEDLISATRSCPKQKEEECLNKVQEGVHNLKNSPEDLLGLCTEADQVLDTYGYMWI
ncbi:hypothetical protein KR009_009202 [Drosophila setifemur]|nr:hypothetical protein KR009_009202 [Drosophila setifemur]